MRAYKAADTSKDGFIQRREFEQLIRMLAYYDALGKIFKTLDSVLPIISVENLIIIG